ncbi:MAG: response regulator transcription factor [Magnetococcales bacterium]|nr:response regulator transcription factor [Magnetococcales bacterium]
MRRTTPLIGLLEDDASMRFLMSSYLEKSGYRVFTCATTTEFLAAFAKEKPDCILLDLNLPDEDGLVVVRKIRYHSNLPLFIVSSRNSEQDRVAGIELGADDYITKPFHPRELVARIHNILQRNARFSAPGNRVSEANSGVIHFRGFSLDLEKRRLETEQGDQIILTRGEFNCLATLVKARGAVVTREQLKDAISPRQEPPQDRTVDSIVCRLRQKMHPENKKANLIATVSGYGYQMDPCALQAS